MGAHVANPTSKHLSGNAHKGVIPAAVDQETGPGPHAPEGRRFKSAPRDLTTDMVYLVERHRDDYHGAVDSQVAADADAAISVGYRQCAGRHAVSFAD